MRKSLSLLLFLFLFLITMSGIGSANPITYGTIGPSCASCSGAVYTISTQLLSAAPGGDVYQVTLDINTATYNGGGLYINAVAPKLSSSYISVLPISSPSSGNAWTTDPEGLNASGCGGGGAGFWCSTTVLGALVSNINNEWTWNLTLVHGATPFADPGDASLKVLYVDSNGQKTGALMSENLQSPHTTNVPEPTPLISLGAGILCISFLRRKLTQRKTITG